MDGSTWRRGWTSRRAGTWESVSARSLDIEATSRRQRALPAPPIVFDYDDGLGLDLFTTDLSPKAFFCTDRVLRCASRNRLTNIRFCRIEEGEYAKPIEY